MDNAWKRIRTEIGCSQRELAMTLGISRQAVTSYEDASRSPSRDVAYRLIDLANDLGIEVSLEEIYPRPMDVAPP